MNMSKKIEKEQPEGLPKLGEKQKEMMEKVYKKPDEPKPVEAVPKPNNTTKKEPQLQSTWPMVINKWGDLHFRKSQLESLKALSKIEQGQNLTVIFLPGKMMVSCEAKKV